MASRLWTVALGLYPWPVRAPPSEAQSPARAGQTGPIDRSTDRAPYAWWWPSEALL